MANLRIWEDLNEYSVPQYVNEIDKAEEAGEDLNVDLNCFGGSVSMGYSLIERMLSFAYVIYFHIGNSAFSMASYLPLFFDPKNISCTDVSIFLFHRAHSYGERYRKETKDLVTKINVTMREKIEERLGDKVKTFEKMGGVTMEELFNMESDEDRPSIQLNGKQMKKLGLIQGKIDKLSVFNPIVKNYMDLSLKNEYNCIPLGARASVKAIFNNYKQKKGTIPKIENLNNLNENKMTKSEIIAQFPNEVKEIQAEATAQETKRLKELIACWAMYLPENFKDQKESVTKKIVTGITELKEMTHPDTHALMLLRSGNKDLEDAKNESQENGGVDVSKNEMTEEDFQKAVKAEVNEFYNIKPSK